MSFKPSNLAYRIRALLRTALVGPQILAFLPALTLGGYWYGGEALMLYMALLLPACFAIAGLFSGNQHMMETTDSITGLRLRKAIVLFLDAVLATRQLDGKSSAAVVVSLDDFSEVERQFGSKAASQILAQTAERLVSATRDSDLIVRLEQNGFAIALAPSRRMDLETLIQTSARLQAAIAEPYSVDATRVYVTASVGFCSAARAPHSTGIAMLDAAEEAMETAKASGAGSIRAYSPGTKNKGSERHTLFDEVANALETGQIRPWFQPYISTDTGEITGFEAVTRWAHPTRGTILPKDFIPAIVEQGLIERLGEITLFNALSAYKDWEKAGAQIDNVSVGLSHHELQNPKLCDQVRWELDRLNVAAKSLCLEIGEETIADTKDDVIVRNICALSELDCQIDLDQFGTGHASIANIRRFSISRIKIDRSFVTRVDRDRDQQNMVAAILTMAERLELDTLAKGVETIGEHAMLAQLGCGHVQGFTVAKPMPLEATFAWIKQHKEKQVALPALNQRMH